ncbi:MAG TPA: AAA family ATPase [Dehalococcoidia bacterium]|nr:AAA family ATPase [Dehalococcoidia bacterium]
MKLVEVQVQRFRNFIDSTPVAVQPDITCLVGKNESGKSAFLHALYRLNPARPNVKFSAPDDYPAWLEKRDRLQGVKVEEVLPVKGVFEFETSDRVALEQQFGPGVLKQKALVLERQYDGLLVHDLDVNEKAVVRHILDTTDIPTKIRNAGKPLETIDGLKEFIQSVQAEDSASGSGEAAQALEKRLSEVLRNRTPVDVIWDAVEELLPEFFYYHQYSNLPYSVKIARVLKEDPRTLDDSELTARSLLKLAAAEDQFLLNPDYERRKRELENVANSITQDVRKYWTQNPELRVQPDITQVAETNSQGERAVLDELKIRVWDDRHSLSLPFDQHSTGFQWFFSFLAAFSEYEYKDTPVIILLDEPALGLHGRAQADFLRFIEERLATKHQVLYTTHSPFMIQPGRLERVRIVEDHGPEKGAEVTQNVLTSDQDTLFPLQGALGYDLVQHLFIAPHNLLVEGTADYTYLTVISDHLKQAGRTGLDERWSIIPVGSADMIPTFVALLGHHLEVTVLIDSRRAGHQRLSQLAADGFLNQQRIITVGQVLSRRLADIEDLFTVADYLHLYNKAFGGSVSEADLAGTDPVVNRLARHQGVERFDHGRPADVLLRRRDELLPQLSPETFERFERLFQSINATLPKD